MWRKYLTHKNLWNQELRNNVNVSAEQARLEEARRNERIDALAEELPFVLEQGRNKQQMRGAILGVIESGKFCFVLIQLTSLLTVCVLGTGNAAKEKKLEASRKERALNKKAREEEEALKKSRGKRKREEIAETELDEAETEPEFASKPKKRKIIDEIRTNNEEVEEEETQPKKQSQSKSYQEIISKAQVGQGRPSRNTQPKQNDDYVY